MQMVLFKDNKRFIETKFKKEETFENLILANSKGFFGASSLIIDLKKKIGTQFLGGTIPDFFLMKSSTVTPTFLIEKRFSYSVLLTQFKFSYY